MALYCYISTKADTLLPDPWGPLAKYAPSTRITSNEEVRPLLEAPNQQAGQSTKR